MDPSFEKILGSQAVSRRTDLYPSVWLRVFGLNLEKAY